MDELEAAIDEAMQIAARVPLSSPAELKRAIRIVAAVAKVGALRDDVHLVTIHLGSGDNIGRQYPNDNTVYALLHEAQTAAEAELARLLRGKEAPRLAQEGKEG